MLARRSSNRKKQWASDRRSFIINILSGLTTGLLTQIGKLPWTRKRRDVTIQACAASASANAPTPKAFSISFEAGVSPFHGSLVYEPIGGPNAPGGQHHGQV